jgi:hypothetical protein
MRFFTMLLFLFFVAGTSAADFERAKGLSAHFLPKRVADADKSKEIKWGFMASTAKDVGVAFKDRQVFQSVGALIGYFQGLDAGTRSNGIWIVTTNPAAYSSEETALLEDLKRECKRQAIPLFVARGSELPNGWQRHSRAESTYGT